MKKTRNVCMIRGIAIKTMCRGLARITSPWNEKMMTNVKRSPMVVTFPNFGIKWF
jgi:hypothetical protein